MAKNITLKILESKEYITKSISKLIIAKINKAVSSSMKGIIKALQREMREWLEEELVIRDLRGSGTLAAEVGLPSAQAASAADSIVEAVVESTGVEFKPFNTKFDGGLSINIEPEDFRNLLGIGEATIVTTKGQSLDWLEWLLKAGSKIIVKDYEITYGNYGQRSRSGLGAIMVKKEGKGFWKMPAKYAGTEDNNFITNALEDRGQVITSIMTKQIKSKIV